MIIYILLIALLSLICIHKNSSDDEIYSLKTVNFLKGMMAIFVIMNHIFEKGYILASIALGLFFCFSGYGIKYKYGKKTKLKDVFYKITSIYLPLFIINVCTIFYNILVKNIEYTFLDVVKSFLFCNIVTYGWFIIDICLLYLCSYFIYKIKNMSENIKDIIMCIFTILLVILLYLLGFESWWYCSLLGFPMGIIIYKNRNKRVKLSFIVPILIILTISTLCVVKNIREGILFCAIQVVNSLLICFSYFLFGQKYNLKNSIIELIGKNSLYIYLIHPLFLKLLKFNEMLQLPIILVLSLSISIIIKFITRNERKKIQ